MCMLSTLTNKRNYTPACPFCKSARYSLVVFVFSRHTHHRIRFEVRHIWDRAPIPGCNIRRQQRQDSLPERSTAGDILSRIPTCLAGGFHSVPITSGPLWCIRRCPLGVFGYFIRPRLRHPSGVHISPTISGGWYNFCILKNDI